MEIKYKNSNLSLTIYVYGELDECSASNAKNILDKLLFDNLTTKKVIFDYRAYLLWIALELVCFLEGIISLQKMTSAFL